MADTLPDSDAQERATYADRVLAPAASWPAWWSRNDQVEAYAEGWSIAVFDAEPVKAGTRPAPSSRPYIRYCHTDGKAAFKTDREAVAYVTFRAQEGSDLHCRALTLHTASVLMYGKQG